MNTIKKIAFCALFIGPGAVFSQNSLPLVAPQNVVTLSASAVVEVVQDQLEMRLRVSREGGDAQALQTQLNAVLERALAQARQAQAPGRMQVRSGQFGVYPRADKNGQFSSWQGSAELVLEGQDFARIAQTATQLEGMVVSHVAFGLSQTARSQVAAQARNQAIDNFKTEAQDVARAFGFAGYSLREVAVHGNDPQPPRPRMLAMTAKTDASEAPLALEAGKSSVQVTVSGSVQLR